MVFETTVYLLWLGCFSASLLLLPHSSVQDLTLDSQCTRFTSYYSQKDRLRLAFEIPTMVLALPLLLLHIMDALNDCRRHGHRVRFCCGCGRKKWKHAKDRPRCQLPTLASTLLLTPHLLFFGAVIMRLNSLSSDSLPVSSDSCQWQISLLSFGNFSGWLLLPEYIMLERNIGPFFIMVSEMIRRDFIRFMVIPGTIIPAFAVSFYMLFSFTTPTIGEEAVIAADAHSSVWRSAFTLILMGVGLGNTSMFGGVTGGLDSRVLVLLLLFIMLIPILALNLLVAMMADTYIDVRSASLNRWSLRQARYLLSRQRFARFWTETHMPRMHGGFAFKGHYDHFFTGAAAKGDVEETVQNLRRATYDEAKRASRLSELAVESIGGLNELLAEQVRDLRASLLETKLENRRLGKHMEELIRKFDVG
eukprot:SAG31_NODE_3288_length_4459_cov_30.078440_2_plen_419_part_00